MKSVDHQYFLADRRPHIVVINRWQERYAEYCRYLDHHRYQVSYVSTAVGLASVPVGAATELVDATDDLAAVRAAVRGLARRYGAPPASPGGTAHRQRWSR